MSDSLDPDQVQHNFGPDLGANCLHGLSADVKVTANVERVKSVNYLVQIVSVW